MLMNFILIFTLKCLLATASLHSKFRHFEEIYPQNIKIRSMHKKDLRNIHSKSKSVSFNALGNKFQLELSPDTNILSPDFKVQLVDAAGRTTDAPIQTDGVYSGHEKINPSNKVNAVNHEGLWYFYIWTPEDIFVVEPIWRLDPQNTGNKLIAYKSRDVLTNSTENDNAPFCRVSSNDTFFRNVDKKASFSFQKNIDHNTLDKNIKSNKRHPLGNTGYVPSIKKNEKKPSRQARMADDLPDTCDVLVIIDFDAYKGVGKQSPPAIVKWVITLFQAANHVLRTSGLSLDGTTYGVRVTGISIHIEYTTPVSEEDKHYNMESNMVMSLEDTLLSLIYSPGHSRVCLSHLLTQRKSPRVAGGALVASKEIDDPNGICMTEYMGASRNVGFTTVLGLSGLPLSLDEHIISLSHELGHNFGAEHDPKKDPICAPSTSDGGKYLMYPGYAKDGKNRRKFSPCSIKRVKGVMAAKAHICFRPRNSLSKFCGNGIVSQEEDCDFGLVNGTTKDKCCTAKCKFSDGAVCSPQNHPCCTQDCKVGPSTQVCVRDVENSCVKESLCNGVDAFTCPRPPPKQDGEPCGDNGMCWNGNCFPYCANKGRMYRPPQEIRDCDCDQNATMMCTVCCQIVSGFISHKCEPQGMSRPNGSSCLTGVCQNGVCDNTFTTTSPIQTAPDKKKDSDSDSNQSNQMFADVRFILAIVLTNAITAIH